MFSHSYCQSKRSNHTHSLADYSLNIQLLSIKKLHTYLITDLVLFNFNHKYVCIFERYPTMCGKWFPSAQTFIKRHVYTSASSENCSAVVKSCPVRTGRRRGLSVLSFDIMSLSRAVWGPAHIRRAHTLFLIPDCPHPEKEPKAGVHLVEVCRRNQSPTIRCCVWHWGFWCGVSSVEWKFVVTCYWALGTPQKFKDKPLSSRLGQVENKAVSPLRITFYIPTQALNFPDLAGETEKHNAEHNIIYKKQAPREKKQQITK